MNDADGCLLVALLLAVLVLALVIFILLNVWQWAFSEGPYMRGRFSP